MSTLLLWPQVEATLSCSPTLGDGGGLPEVPALLTVTLASVVFLEAIWAYKEGLVGGFFNYAGIDMFKAYTNIATNIFQLLKRENIPLVACFDRPPQAVPNQ